MLAVYLFCLALCELLYISTLPLWVIYIQHGHRWPLQPPGPARRPPTSSSATSTSASSSCAASLRPPLAVVYVLEMRPPPPEDRPSVSAAVFLLVGLVHSPVSGMEHSDTCFETLPADRRVAGYYYARHGGCHPAVHRPAVTNQRIFRDQPS